jgi:hypothetical protein
MVAPVLVVALVKIRIMQKVVVMVVILQGVALALPLMITLIKVVMEDLQVEEVLAELQLEVVDLEGVVVEPVAEHLMVVVAELLLFVFTLKGKQHALRIS